MKRIFSSPFVAIAAGLCLRLFFVLKFPAGSGDTVLYDQMATYWLKNGVYAMLVGGQITPVDLRMPGYPAFLATIYAITGRSGADHRLLIMLAQIAVDLLSCLAIAWLASLLTAFVSSDQRSRRVFTSALWLAVSCPFTSNYTAVPLTEVFSIFFTALALLLFCLPDLCPAGRDSGGVLTTLTRRHGAKTFWAASGFVTGIGTLFRPEQPLVLLSAWMVLGFLQFRGGEFRKALRLIIISGLACAAPLVPWMVRNAITLHEFQPLAPKNSNLPGELVPYGFMSWEKTWLYRFRDVYLVPWKLNDEVIRLDDIPKRAFDTPDEKARVAAILEQYNDDITLTPEEDAAFAQLARERTARHPLRTYFWLPSARAMTMWFTPRIELLPLSGEVFPLEQAWEDDPVDQSVTGAFFLLNIVYVALAAWGAVRLWRYPAARGAVVLLVAFILVRTTFLTALETPEPRYVLECFPAILALAAQVFAQRGILDQASSGSGWIVTR